MKFSEFVTLTKSDLYRYSGSAGLIDNFYHYLLSPSMKEYEDLLHRIKA